MSLKVFTGANGYYVADEDETGTHYQPHDNGATIGWDISRAEEALRAELQAAAAEEYFREAEDMGEA